MAVAPQIYSGVEYRVAFAEQAIWGTANSTQGDFFEFPVTELVMPDFSGILADETKRSNGKKVMDVTDVFRSNAGSEYSVQVSGVLHNNIAAKLFYGATQLISGETDSGAYAKTFTVDGSSVGASHTPSAIHTLLFYNPSTTKHISAKDCVLKTLTVSCDPGSNGGRATFQATFIVCSAPTMSSVTATPASWVAPDNTFYLGQTLATKTLAGSDLVLGKYELTIDNGATRVGYKSTGDAEGASIQMVDVTGSVEVKYDNNTFGLIDKWLLSPVAGSADSDLVLVHGSAGSAGHLSLTLHTIANAVPSLAASEKGVFQTYGFRAVTESTTAALTVIVSDGLNENWIGA